MLGIPIFALLQATEQGVAEIPSGVGGQVEGVGPETTCDLGGVAVGDRIGNGDGRTDGAAGGGVDAYGNEVGGRRGIDNHRRDGAAGVVILVGGLVDVSAWAESVGHIGEDEDIVATQETARDGEVLTDGVARGGGEHAIMRDGAEIMVALNVEVFVAREEDVIGPGVLTVWNGAEAGISHGVIHAEATAGEDIGIGRDGGAGDSGDAKIGSVDARDMHGTVEQIIRLAGELLHLAHE